MNRNLCGWLVIAVLAPFAQVHAQGWPAKPVRIISSNGAGSSPNLVARMLADHMSRALGKAFIVENIPGAGGNIGAQAAARSAPDGYTLFLATLGTLVINAHTFKSLPFDPVRDFIPVSMVVSSSSFVVAVNSNVPARSIAELVALAKTRPGKISYGVTINEAGYIGEWLDRTAGTQTLQVPYKTNPQAIQDAIAGRLEFVIVSLPLVDPFVKAGKLRLLAISGPNRFPGFPDLPAIAETYPGLVWNGWFALVAPAGTPADIVQRANRETELFLRDPDAVQRMLTFGFAVTKAGTPESLAEFIRVERERMGKVMKDLGVEPQ